MRLMVGHNRTLALSLWLLCLVVVLPVRSQGFLWWNVENLFDTVDDPRTRDEDFTPQGTYHWTGKRYWHKLDNVSRTIAAVADAGNGWPAVIGMCEVENDTVMRDLCKRSPLRKAGYKYRITHGPDARGVNVALLYRSRDFRLIHCHGIRVPSAKQRLRPTRDILYATGIVPWLPDTLHLLLVHFPSRAGGGKEGKQNRMLAARTLRHAVDSIQYAPGGGRRLILVMGDFNAEPGDEIFPVLMPELVSLVPQKKSELSKPIGSYCYKGHWGYLDHVMVSKSMSRYVQQRVNVGRFPFLLDKKGFPWRTYRGPSYQGGYSDHLPVWVERRPQ